MHVFWLSARHFFFLVCCNVKSNSYPLVRLFSPFVVNFFLFGVSFLIFDIFFFIFRINFSRLRSYIFIRHLSRISYLSEEKN